MFKSLRQVSEGLRGLVIATDRVDQTLRDIHSGWDLQGPLLERIETLERAREGWEAQMEAELLRVQSSFKAARSAEERTRTMAAHAEALSGGDEGEEALNEYREFLRTNGEGVPPVALPQVPAPLAVDAKTRAIQAKFGAVI